jgi:hypothetical protein
MAEVLLALVALTISCLLATVATVAGTCWWLRKRNRVHPRRRSAAPLTWLASPVAPARAHRQLRGAVRLTLEPPLPSALAVQAAELHDQAALIDTELVHAARLPRPDRHRRMRPLQGRVAVLERTAVQLVDLARHPAPDAATAPGAAPDGLSDLAERVGLLAQARDELARLTMPRLPTGSPWSATGPLATGPQRTTTRADRA